MNATALKHFIHAEAKLDRKMVDDQDSWGSLYDPWAAYLGVIHGKTTLEQFEEWRDLQDLDS